MQQLHEFHDRVTPPTPPVPEPSYPPAQLAYCGTRTSLASSQSSSSLSYSPYSPTHLSLPGSYDSPSLHVPSLYPSPNQHSLSGYLASPVVGTPSTYYSFYDSPSASSVTNYHSLPTSPALQIGSAFASPAQAGPSALPNDPGPISQFRPSPPRPLVPAVLTRRPVPQLYRIRPNSPLTERFTVDGAPGVSVLGVLKKSVTVDEPSERVLREIYMRQIHLFVSWPGYETKGIYIKLTQNGGHTTRGELVERLCSRLAAIMRAFAKTERDRSESIPYRPTPWAVGRNGMTIDNLWLLAIGPQSQVDARRPWAVELEVHE
ncbi:hypothetical protein PYCCODRAFT_443783 [Trametes coccinea BRFM310]|uniref:Uncharacterized protein n=1 Tax=Trametes coccinea (strain BRFM310) TaxID=1353009 RepID=A0A1Y2IQ98_TRAC3|nr:hypothetical protein PYCCODRAFT_443783 [Trametes coccinea BRFM310]